MKEPKSPYRNKIQVQGSSQGQGQHKVSSIPENPPPMDTCSQNWNSGTICMMYRQSFRSENLIYMAGLA